MLAQLLMSFLQGQLRQYVHAGFSECEPHNSLVCLVAHLLNLLLALLLFLRQHLCCIYLTFLFGFAVPFPLCYLLLMRLELLLYLLLK